MALKIAGIIPDLHIPYHHRRAYQIALDVFRDLGKDLAEIVILGDFGDFYCVSSHQKDPRILQHLIGEVDDINSELDKLDKLFPTAKKVFLEGNHEFRLERYLIQNCPALFGVTELQFLLKFNQRYNWKFIKYGPNQSYDVLGSYLKARHEPLSLSAKATASKALCSLVYGHIHRIEESHIVGLDGTNHVCFSIGWLGDKRNDLIFNYVKGHHQWQLGFGLVYVDTESRLFYHQKIPILDIDGKVSCVVNGKLYT